MDITIRWCQNEFIVYIYIQKHLYHLNSYAMLFIAYYLNIYIYKYIYTYICVYLCNMQHKGV